MKDREVLRIEPPLNTISEQGVSWTFPKNALFMKYGVHAGESIESIIDRKKKEIEACGYAFWGYGGTLCHPQTQLKPFLEAASSTREDVYALFMKTPSRFDGNTYECSEFSHDKSTWNRIPNSLSVIGSRYALVIDSLEIVDLRVSPSGYRIAVGPSKGKPLHEYLRGRVDKACATLFESEPIICDDEPAYEVSLLGKVTDAVFVR